MPTIETWSGRMIDPFDPDPRAFDLKDISHALANICRFNGHTARHYSVAEHSIYVADLLSVQRAPREVVLAGLMHDAAEAYVGDMVTPLKSDHYRDIERLIMERMAQRFGFAWPIPCEVKKADTVLLWCEASVLLRSGGTSWAKWESQGREIVKANEPVRGWIDAGYNRSAWEPSLAYQFELYAIGEGINVD